MSHRKPYTLHPSPLTMLRFENRMTMEDAALKLGIATLQVARIEAATKRIPRRTQRSMRALLNPPDRHIQMSIFDYLSDLDRGGVHV